jgi:peptidoglycan/xylan/chitin deacetylase (PgdA/CDA1 family)
MIRNGKEAAFRTADRLGANSAVMYSGWRRSRLLILCYHGISIHDEHEWNPELYMSVVHFRRRMEALRRSKCQVLSLREAMDRLACGELDRPSVVITFDDGTHDFYLRALPVIRDYGFPATVYLTTYYCGKNMPVFDGICSYLLWKARGRIVNFGTLTGRSRIFDLGKEDSAEFAAVEMRRFAEEERLSSYEKNDLIKQLAKQTGIDLTPHLAKRILHIMTPGEVKEVAQAGVDVQLHTHRHRTPTDRLLFIKEIEENRAFIEILTGAAARDFCYPSGICRREFLPWLREMNIRSATTCEPGLAVAHSDRLLLPRLVDTSVVSDAQFECWLSGIASLLPRRTASAGKVHPPHDAEVCPK